MSDKKDTVKVVLKTSSLAPGAKNVDLNSLRQILARAQNRQQSAKAPVTQTDGDEKRQDVSRKTPEVPKKTSISTKVFPDKNAGAQNDDAQSIGVEDKDKAPNSPTRVTESTGYTCCFCAFHSEDPESYRKHIASHIRNKGLCCNTCSFSTDKINAFNEHVRTAHKKVPPIKTTYACGVCDFKAFTSETLWKHKISTKHHKLNDKNEPIACRLCGHLETNVYKQVQHIMSHSRADVECDLCDDPQDSDVQKHSDDCPEVVSPLAHQYDELLQKPGRRSYQCTLCDFQTEQLLFLMEHIKAHSRFRPSADETKELDSPFSCTMCEYKCVRPSKLVLHMKTHGPGTIFRCKDCKFESSDMEIFKSHWKRHSSIRFYRCFVCLEQFPSSRALNAHMVTHTKGAPLECSICDFKCLSKNRLILHTKSHAKVPKTILSFPCSLCKNKYSTHAALKIHLKSHDASDRPYQCKHCPYNCFTPELLKIHLKKHSSNGSKFRCEICMLSFPTEAQLRGHVQDHVTYDKPVNCELCNTSFVSKAQLSKHMAIHSGKYPFVCAVCSTGFMDEAAKKEHLLNVHEIQDQGGPSSTSGKDIVELEEDEQIVSVEEQPSTQFGYLEENVDEDSEDELAH